MLPQTTFVAVSSIAPALAQPALQSLLGSEGAAAGAFNASESRWAGYLQTVLGESATGLDATGLDANMQWTVVKALQTLMYNWRTVPGIGEGVLPSYNNYDSGMWSWDTYKQAVVRKRALQWFCDAILLLSSHEIQSHLPRQSRDASN